MVFRVLRVPKASRDLRASRVLLVFKGLMVM